MTELLTVVGRVATDPVRGQTRGGTAVTNFRLASTHRRLDPVTQVWVDGETNWFSVAAFRQLGEHAKASLRCGDSVIVTGRLKIRNWESNGKSGTSVDIEADAIGHDLRWGTTAYLRTPRSSAAETSVRATAEQEPAQHEPLDESDVPLSLSSAWDELPGVTDSAGLSH
ncbi:single-stranded DNA-binding protein [Microbacterium saperdae]|uniref:Single-stranded DNA-binding protein n=1 Tax=Microbacterium saperdae TaxID=69368 RepID=A0A543BMY8_9MICO|nr:single-stranded DNA-binding protein [Microbacterium saperdae]TQL86209.1 single-strand DNA-binding protein [Microbacterium saperdae]GGM49765.1 single-stranded DNA-binding protein 1 [Microbacterium saperdae]